MDDLFRKGSARRVCPICGTSRSKKVFKQRFAAMSSGALSTGYDVVVCVNCGFGFADNVPDQVVFDTYYRNMSKYEFAEARNQEAEYEIGRLSEVTSIIRRFLCNENLQILDIGCATGSLLHMLKQTGYHNVLGVDPSPACAERAQELYGIQVLTGSVFDLPAAVEPFDFLILLGVLEHIRDLAAAVTSLSNLLTAHGQVYVGVPDASRFSEGANAPFQEFSVEHINFFSPVSLGNLMRAGGFVAKYCRQSIARVNCRTTAPVIHAVYQKRQSDQEPAYIVDVETESGLKDYMARSSQVDEQLHQVVDGLVTANNPVIVWGAGAHTLRLLANSRLPEAQIKAFVDSNPRYQGKHLIGIPIIPPIELKGRHEAIFISSWVFQREIELKIREDLNCSNEVILPY